MPQCGEGSFGVRAATVVAVDAQEIAQALGQAGVDPAMPVVRMVEEARRAGVRARTGDLKAGAVEHKRRSGLVVRELERTGWTRRAEAARALGVSVKRVDQLRAAGVLRSWRHPYTGSVWVSDVGLVFEGWRRWAP